MESERKKVQKSAYIQVETLEERIKNASKQTRAVRDYQKKKPTKEEKNKVEYEEMLHYNDKVEEIHQEEVVNESEWDVPIGAKIEIFDPSLSYELTGYRPITKDKGLDFDPKLFTVPADTYRKDGRYTRMVPNTFKWINYWTDEFHKCQKGVTIGKYTLTGQNYFFLNYYRLLSPIEADESGASRSEDFPVFIAKQYEYFHYLELCKKAGYDGLAFKSRGVNKPALL